MARDQKIYETNNYGGGVLVDRTTELPVGFTAQGVDQYMVIPVADPLTGGSTFLGQASSLVLPAGVTDLTAGVSGAAIGAVIGGATSGSILFAGPGGLLAQDNANLFWNNTSKQLFVKGPSIFIGNQGVQDGQLRLCHAQTLRSIPNAHMGIFTSTGMWHNDGDYESTVAGFGWNMLSEQADEAHVGMSVEQTFAQGLGQPHGVELHLVAGFPDSAAVRMLSSWVDRAAPHLAQTQLSGEFSFCSSPGGSLINGRVHEGGGTTWWHGNGTTNTHNFNNWVFNASEVGKGSIRITPDDSYPNLGFLLGGSEKAAIFVDMTAGGPLGSLFLQLRVAGSAFHMRGGPLVIENGSITTSAPTDGTAAAWKLGVAASVTPTAPNRTVELNVDGTTLYLAAKTTNN